MTSPDVSNLLIYNSINDISYIEYNRPGIPYNFDATYIYHNNQNYNDGSYGQQIGTINNNLIIESATSNILLVTAEDKKVRVKNSMAVNANLDVSNILTTNRLIANDISLNNILYLNSSTSLPINVFGDLKIQGSISQVTLSNEEVKGFTSDDATLITSTFTAGDISQSRIILSNITSSNIYNSYIYNTPIGYSSSNISIPNKAVFTDVSLENLTLTGPTSYVKFQNNNINPTVIRSSDDYSKLIINKPLIVGLSQDIINVSNISIFNGDISCHTLYYSQLNPDIRLNNYFDVSIGTISLAGNIIPTTTNTFTIGSTDYKFNQIYSTSFIGDLTGTASLANDLKKNLDMSFNNLDISGIIRLGGLDLNTTLQGSYLTISQADISFNALNNRINEISSNVYNSAFIDICLNTNYVTNRAFELSFQDLSGRILGLSGNVHSKSFIDICLNNNYVKVSTANASQFSIFDKFTFESSGNYIQKISSGYNSTIISEWRTDWLSANNPVIRFSANGDITNINNSYGGWSDIRLKENIVNTGPKLQDLLKVRVVNYNLKGLTSSNKHIGVIAQELEEVFPSLVSNQPLSEEDIKSGKTESYKSVNYSSFTLMLIKALQEEQEIINKLDAKIITLNKDYNAYKDLQEHTKLLINDINTLKQENVILKYKLNEVLTGLGKTIMP